MSGIERHSEGELLYLLRALEVVKKELKRYEDAPYADRLHAAYRDVLDAANNLMNELGRLRYAEHLDKYGVEGSSEVPENDS